MIAALTKMVPGFSPTLKKVLIILTLTALCAGVVSYKFYLLNKLPFFNAQDGEGFFWTESAFHFRHFQMVAEGAGIPPVDYGIQHPEGLDTVRYITPVMERVAGNLYRLFFSDTPPHLFLVCFSFLFSTLSVLAIFFAGKIAWRSNPAALICAFFYGVTPASLTRTAGGGFIREDFALPFIFFSFACFIFCLRKDKPSVSLLGSLLLIIALSAWHVTQLYLSLFMVGLVVVYFVKNDVTFLSKSYLIFLATMVLAALILPALRAKYFIFSPAMMLGYSLLIVSWVSRKNFGNPTMRNFLVSGLVIVIFFAGSLFIQRFSGSYSHVYELLLFKLRFLGVLPEDPARLSFEAKSMWTSAFVSPKLAELPTLLSFSLLFGTVGIGILIYRMITKAAETHEVLILYFSISMFLLFLMIHRMSVFAVFFMALSMGALTLFRKRHVNYAIYFSLGICFLIQISILPSFKLLAFRPDQDALKNLISYIRDQSAIDTPVLTTFELGPAVAAYAGRPVVLHSKFESPQLRDKVKAVYTSLYQSEEAFYELCKRYKAGIFVYQNNMALGHGPGSIRYVAGAASLETESAAFLFHFAPERLKHFSLIYQNPAYRVFRAGKSAAHEMFDIKYQPIYDLANFSEEKNLGRFFDDGLLKPGLRKLRSSGTHLKIGDRFFALGDYRTAVLQYERALMIDRRNKQAAWSLVMTLSELGEDKRMAEALRGAVSLDSDYDVTALNFKNTDIWAVLGSEALGRKRYQRAEKIFRKAVDINPDSEAGYFGLGLTLLAEERFVEAESALQKVVVYNPNNFQAFENLGKISAARGDMSNAVFYVEKSLSINPSQPRLNQVLDLLQKKLAAQKINKDNFNHYIGLGTRKAKDGEFEDAIAMYLEAAKIKTTDSLMFNLGLVSYRMKKNDDAVIYLKKALAINPEKKDAGSLLRHILKTEQMKKQIRISVEEVQKQ